jgi:hypothetical protein
MICVYFEHVKITCFLIVKIKFEEILLKLHVHLTGYKK